MPDTTLSTLDVLTQSSKFLLDKYYYFYLYLMEKKTKAQNT